MRTGLYGAGALTLVVSLVMSGLLLAPQSASAFWWPWGDHHNKAHAQESDRHDDDTVTITIQKYMDGERATEENTDNHAFPMTASWDDPEDGDGDGTYTLSSDNAFTAKTSKMHVGADYSTSEVLDGDTVGAHCDDGHPYKLVGYSTGASMEAAAEADVSTDAPAFSDLEADQYVIVWNESCEKDDDDGDNPSEGSISGEVTGGQSDDAPGELAVESVDAQKTTATANGTFADGWQYVYTITVPDDEPNLAMQFADWMQTDGEHTIPVADNMRISSEQASTSTPVTLTAANAYSSPELTMTGDLDAEKDGLQVEVLVEVAIPSDTYNGTYSTEYGVRTLP